MSRKLVPLCLTLLLVSSLALVSAARAEGPVDLLAGSAWQYSVDGGRTFSPTPPVLSPETELEVLGALAFTVQQLPADTACLEFSHSIKPYAGVTASFALNNRPIPVPLEGMQYRVIPGIDPDCVQLGENLLTIRLKVGNFSNKYYKAEPVNLAFQASLLAQPAEAFRIQTGPVLGAVGHDFFTVTCRTNMPATVQVLVRGAGAESAAIDTETAGNGFIHRFRVSGLASGTPYEYQLVAQLPDTDAFARSDKATVKTLTNRTREPGKPLRFVAMGDSRTKPADWAKVAAAAAAAEGEFLIFGGDSVAYGPDDWQWDNEFFGPSERLFAYTPTYVVIGNHEENAPLFDEMFYAAGDNSRARNWSQQIDDVLIIGVDGRQNWAADSSNAAWLEGVLAASDAKFIFLATHFPAWTSGGHGRIEEGRFRERAMEHSQKVIMPLLEKYHATAMIAGHDHYYERSEPAGGVSVVIAGRAGAPAAKPVDDAKTQNPHSVVFNDSLNYAIFEIDGDTCTMRVLSPEGDQIDTRTWQARKTAPAVAAEPEPALVQ